jgi:hypothetical protein
VRLDQCRVVRGRTLSAALLLGTLGVALGVMMAASGLAWGGLPDGRAYEQVSPISKNGQSIVGDFDTERSAADGQRVTFYSPTGIPGGEGAQDFPVYSASRNAAGWSTVGILPPASFGPAASVAGLPASLENSFSVTRDEETGLNHLLDRNTEQNAVSDLAEGREIVWDAESANGSAVEFESKSVLAPGAVAGVPNVYVWHRASGIVVLASVLNSGATPEFGAFAGSYDWVHNGTPESVPKSGRISYFKENQHVLSYTGETAFFTELETGQLYARINLAEPQSPLDGSGKCTDSDDACTIQLSSSLIATPDPSPKPSAFLGASTNGEVAYFLSPEALTEDSNTGSAGEGEDLYRFNTADGRLEDLTPESSPSAPNGAEARGVLGMSDDGSYVYFAANGVLTGAPNASGEVAQPGNCVTTRGLVGPGSGTCNIYLRHANVTTFIAPIDSGSPVGEFGNAALLAGSFDWNPYGVGGDGAKNTPSARVSAAGKALVFRASNKLSGYENAGVPEFYYYDASANTIRCISCSRTGQAPVGPPAFASAHSEVATLPELTYFLSRNMSASGERVFFETPDALSPEDVNGEDGCPFPEAAAQAKNVRSCQDVYEWEAPGAGTCPASTLSEQGCVFLISSGMATEPTYFADADESGANVLFLTSQSLVVQDRDHLVDLYDAREGGGIASQNVMPVPACDDEACRGSAVGPPHQSTAGSSALYVPGNSPSTHKKGHHKKGHHKKGHHKKGHHKKGHHKKGHHKKGHHKKSGHPLGARSDKPKSHGRLR